MDEARSANLEIRKLIVLDNRGDVHEPKLMATGLEYYLEVGSHVNQVVVSLITKGLLAKVEISTSVIGSVAHVTFHKAFDKYHLAEGANMIDIKLSYGEVKTYRLIIFREGMQNVQQYS